MKILLFIDSLGSGGAQNQMVILANELNNEGYYVTIITYHDINHFKPYLNTNIECRVFKKSSRFDIFFLRKIIGFLNANIYDCLIAFLFVPSFYCLLIKPFIKYNLKYIISERSFEGATNFFQRNVIRRFYYSADFITTNSISQTNVLLQKLPKLNQRIRHISNGLDLDRFNFVNKDISEIPLFIAVGSVYSLKNVFFLIEALNVLRKNKYLFKFSWVGKFCEADPYFIECNNKLRDYDLLDIWNWEGEIQEISLFYKTADFLIHTAMGEGFPNVICESLACGTPVIASNICDHPYFIKDGRNGYTFGIDDPCSLVDKIKLALDLTSEEYQEMRASAHITAVNNFSKKKLVSEYIKLIKE